MAPLVALGLAVGGVVRAAPARQAWERSVVQLSVTYQTWDHGRPWAKESPGTRQAMGVVVAGHLVLTTAQILSDATLIELEALGRNHPITPRVVAVDPSVDLALLAIDDLEMKAELSPVAVAPRTPTSGALWTVRWSDEQLEVAASRIRRFVVRESFRGSLNHVFMLAQTDISGGGWSEPVFDGDQLVGLTANQDAERRARIIPAEILGAFLRRARDPAHYPGFPNLELSWQMLENPAAAGYFGVGEAPRGVLLHEVPWGSSGCGGLEPMDVLVSLDGNEIASDGTYAHAYLGRLRFEQIIQDGHEVGDAVPARVIRGGREQDVRLVLRRADLGMDLIPEENPEEPPPYLVAGGLVFQELDGSYLASWGKNWRQEAPARLVAMLSLQGSAQTRARRRVVVLASVLPLEYTIGYQDLGNLAVERINDVEVDSIPDVASALAAPGGDFHVVEFLPGPVPRKLVLDAAGLEAATREAMTRYSVPRPVRLPARPPPDPGEGCGEAAEVTPPSTAPSDAGT